MGGLRLNFHWLRVETSGAVLWTQTWILSVSAVTDKEVKWLQIKLDAFLSAINKSYFSKLWTKFGREWAPGPYNGTALLLDILQIDEVDGKVTDLFQCIDSMEQSVLFSFSKVCWLIIWCICMCMLVCISKLNYYGLYTHVDTRFIKNRWYWHSQVSVWIHSNWQRKCRLIKKKIEPA